MAAQAEVNPLTHLLRPPRLHAHGGAGDGWRSATCPPRPAHRHHRGRGQRQEPADQGHVPGLEPTNDDNGVNAAALPLLDIQDNGFYQAHTYHVDRRFEEAFTQRHVLADAIMIISKAAA